MVSRPAPSPSFEHNVIHDALANSGAIDGSGGSAVNAKSLSISELLSRKAAPIQCGASSVTILAALFSLPPIA
jgi:hypothetical protein